MLPHPSAEAHHAPEPAGSPLEGFLGAPPVARCRPAALADLAQGAQSAAPDRLACWLLGTGSPQVLADRAGPANYLEVGDARILVDAGNGAAYQLAKLGRHHGDLTHIFITHHHLDHNTDLPFLLLSPWIDGHPGDPPLILGPAGTVEFVDRFLGLFDFDIRARLPHGYDPARVMPTVVEVGDGDRLVGDGWIAQAFAVDHSPVEPALGFRFDTASGSLAISGDTRPCENLVGAAAGVDVLVHEALFPPHGIPSYHTPVHEVGAVARKVGAGSLVLTHLIPGDLPDADWREAAARDFDGPITVGRDLLRVC